MTHIEPFKGVLYSTKKVKIDKVTAPPYDVIPPETQDELYNSDEYNVVRLILGKETPADSGKNNKYTRAKDFFNSWLEKNVLVQDETPAIYVYSQGYKDANTGENKTSWGFLARMEIEDPKTSRVLPHENTFAKPKQDRLNLIREVRANLSPIFTLFKDEGETVRGLLRGAFNKEPLFDLTSDGVRHRFWRLEDPLAIKKIQGFMRDKDIFIADGHHRFEVARMYREEMRTQGHKDTRTQGHKTKLEGYDYVMVYFAPLDERDLTVLATHRLIKGMDIDAGKLLEKLKEYFCIEQSKNKEELFKKMASVKTDECAFGMYFTGAPFYLLKLKKEVDLDKVIEGNRSGQWKRLDVSILHEIIFDKILRLKDKVTNEEGIVLYTRDPDYAISEVKKGACKAAFLLNPTKVDQVKNIAEIGDKMPHKSTYFYPKLLSGLLINKLM